MTNDPMNPFQAPKAELNVAPPVGAAGSLEDAIAGRYDFKIGEVMSEAWGLVKGFKASFWGAAILVYLVVGALLLVVGGISAVVFGRHANPVFASVINGLFTALLMPLFVGLIAMAIRRASGMPVSFSMAFAYFNKAGTAIVAGLLTTILTYVGIALLVVPGIYLSIAYGMTLPLIAFHNLGAWRSMEASRKALTHKWFRIFGLYLVVGLLVGLSALPLGIPLIWTMPWAILVMGVLYRRIFGAPVAAAT